MYLQVVDKVTDHFLTETSQYGMAGLLLLVVLLILAYQMWINSNDKKDYKDVVRTQSEDSKLVAESLNDLNNSVSNIDIRVRDLSQKIDKDEH